MGFLCILVWAYATGGMEKLGFWSGASAITIVFCAAVDVILEKNKKQVNQ